ncbi:amino acid ABC transporter substrate-binding protein, PAAT family [Limimonas halophila]|uniref:Amino acid ABC transporter substrate-binding protein, PAAT family n=1 Tax=Limimonas halophila TaxID=1082479 RepID=A0A1G7NYJ3_9PROT|nr:transporter substrate-binding domain-containing protein [Limimonas halophila]SDF78429.1 amino acid ABC transporter substrate-binding protein, PAAT family [Limimonas halophila]
MTTSRLFAGVAMAATVTAVAATPSAKAATIELTTVNWAPFYGESLEKGGPVAALAKAAAKEVGHTVTVEFLPWKRAMAMAKRGEKDGMLGAYYTEERDKAFHFTEESFYTVKVGLIADESLGVTSYGSLKDLTQYTIGYQQGWAYPEKFDNADFLEKDPAPNQTASVKKLVHGRVDMVAMSHGIFRNELDKLPNASLDDYVFLEPLLMEGTLHMAISNNAENAAQLARDLDAGLEAIRENGTYERIISKYNM